MLPQFQNDDRDFQLMQNSWGSQLNPVIQQVNNLGQYKEVLVKVSASFPASGTWGDVGSLLLSAGKWDLTALIYQDNNGAIQTGTSEMGISNTPGNSTNGLILGVNRMIIGPVTTYTPNSQTIPSYRIDISSSQTYYLKVKGVFNTQTPIYQCRFSAVKIKDF